MKNENDNELKNTNESEKTFLESPGGFGVRHTLTLMGLLAITVNYSFRTNISVAIIAMVKENSTVTEDDVSDACPVTDDSYMNSVNHTTGDFEWDEQTQGLILGSFYYGYIATNLLGGIAAEYWGGKVVTGVGIIITAILTLLSPLAANLATWLLVTFRIIEGAASGALFPALTSMLASWFPKSERSRYTSIMFSGTMLGTVITLPLSGILCDSNFLGGWPSAFYVFGFIGLIWAVAWFFLITDDPRDHPRISEKELNFIKSGCPVTTKNLERIPIPWKEIFTSIRFWAIAASNFSNNWIFYTLLTELPTYLDQIQHYNIKSNGFLSALPYLGSWLFSMVYSSLINKMILKGTLSVRSVRRLSMAIGNIGPALGFIIVCFVNCNSTLAIVVLIIGQTMNGASYCGYMCSHVDIAPRFAGTLMGITNTFGSIPGFLSPAITGALTQDNQTLWAWRTVFLIAATIAIIFTSFFIIFVTTEHQTWNEPKMQHGKKEKINSDTTSHEDQKEN